MVWMTWGEEDGPRKENQLPALFLSCCLGLGDWQAVCVGWWGGKVNQ